MRDRLTRPRRSRRLVVHSDIGFHNMLIDGGEVTALVDWESCQLGDPREDLNYVRPFVAAVGSWNRFLEMIAGASPAPGS